MSLTALLAAAMGGGSGGPVGPPDPPPGAGDYLAAFIQDDANYAATSTLAPGQSIADAVTALAAAIDTPAYDRNPIDRARLTIPPGTYTERLNRQTSATGAVVDIIGATLNPADVIVTSPDGAEDTIELSGTSGIYAGLTIRATHAPTGATCSPVHNGSGANGEYVFWRCNLERPDLTQDALSWGAEDGGTLLILDCHLAGTGYIHNFGSTKRRTWVQIEETTTTGNVRLFEQIGHPDDRVYIRGGTLAGLSITQYNGATPTTGTWTGSIDPATVTIAAHPRIAATAPALVDMRHRGQENPDWASFWLPDGRGTPVTLAPVVDTSTGSVTAGRCYYARLSTSTLLDVSQWALRWGTVAGVVECSIFPGTAAAPAGAALSSGSGAGATGALFSRTLAPGGTYWLGVRLTSGAATLAVGPAPAGALYADAATLADGVATAAPYTADMPALTIRQP